MADPASLLEARARRYACTLYYALAELLEDTQHAHHNCNDPECPVIQARQVLALVDGQRRGPDSGAPREAKR